MTSAQVLLTFFDMSARTHYLNARQTLTTLLEWRVLPVINENDTTATDEISFGDNDFLAAQVAVLVGGRRAGPADRHRRPVHRRPAPAPRRAHRRRGERLRRARGARDRPHHLAARLGRDALEGGGRRHGHGGGDRDGDLQRAARRRRCAAVLAGERAQGTRFPAREARYSSFKLWLKYAKPSRGTLVIDAGAARAVREGSASLLPVGVVEVLGEFDAGDAVEIVEREARAARARAGARQGDLQLLRRGAAAGDGAEVRRRPRDPAAGDRGGGAPRLPRARLSGPASYPVGPWQPSPHRSRTSAARPSARVARARADRHAPSRTRRCEAIAAALEERERGDPRGQRARHAGRRARRTSATRCSTACASTSARIAAIARGGAPDRGAARPGRRGDRRAAPAQRPGRAQGARAAGRRRGRLRGAARTSRSTRPRCA